MTQPDNRPEPNMKHCYRCGVDVLGNLEHTLEECNNVVAEYGTERSRRESGKVWPPVLETKVEFMKALELPEGERRRLLEGNWTDEV